MASEKGFEGLISSLRFEEERWKSQAAFAGKLIELHRDEGKHWKPLLSKAAALVEKALSAQAEFKAVQAAVREAENLLAPVAKIAKTYTVHCTGHAHIDMNWMWSYPETVAVTNDTFLTMLRLMDEFPDFRFSQSQASVYRFAEEFNPELLERIAKRVKEGRWEVTASHWVENDKNMASGESLARHLLYTRRYFQKLFGLKPEDVPVDWSPDTFGFAATVPTYLAQGGVKYLYLHRPGIHGGPRPEAFWWQGPDGARILVKNDMKRGYNGAIRPESVMDLSLEFAKAAGCKASLLVHGVGDHGGGPTRRDILWALAMNEWPVFPRLAFATVKNFFETLERSSGGSLPEVSGELNTEFTGCYTTETLIKKCNRFAENNLLDAEAASALVHGATGRPYAAGRFEENWRETLFSHFHDILPGSGVHDTRTYAHGMFQRVSAATAMEETNALRALSARVDTSKSGERAAENAYPRELISAVGAGAGFGTADGQMSAADMSDGAGARPFLLFNPTATDRDEVAEAVVWENARGWKNRDELMKLKFSVTAPDGAVQAAQNLEAGAYWGHQFMRLAFPVKVPALGYAVYTVREGETKVREGEAAVRESETKAGGGGVRQKGRGHHCGYSYYERGPEGLENEFVSVDIDPETGGIRRLLDKRTNTAVIEYDGRAPGLLETLLERHHHMTAWLVEHPKGLAAPSVVSLKRHFMGPHKASLDVGLRVGIPDYALGYACGATSVIPEGLSTGNSDFTLTYELRANDPVLYLRVKGTWMERGTPERGVPVLRASVPLALERVRMRYEIPFGLVERGLKDGEEVPALSFALASGFCKGREAGLLFLNDSKHGYALEDRTLRLTLIRSSYDPDPLPEIGQHDIRLGLMPFTGGIDEAEAIRHGAAFNRSLKVISTGVHKGSLPLCAGFVSVEQGAAVLSGLKKAEEGDGLVLRFFNPTGKDAVAEARFNADWIGTPKEAVELDLIERPLHKSSAKVSGGAVKVKVPAGGIATVRVTLGGRK